jgi:hypothetical protein
MNGHHDAGADPRRLARQRRDANAADALIACLLATYDVYGTGADWPECFAPAPCA